MPLSDRNDLTQRPRLDEVRAHALRHRLTIITAGPGFGKSAFLREWADQAPAVLHTCTAADRSVSVLGQNLVEGLRLRVPALVRNLPATGGSVLGEAVVVASELARALDASLGKPLVLLLDDVDELEGSDGAALVEALVRQAPDRLRIVVAGRSAPPFRTARLRIRGDAVQVTAAELTFTADETAALLGRIIPDASADLASHVHRMTGGWPVAVRLAAEAMKACPVEERGRVIDRVVRPGGALFGYLAEEVIGRETAADRDLLRKMAVVGESTVEMWVGLGIGDADTRLGRLGERGVYFDGVESLVLLPLVAEHLRSALPVPEADRRILLTQVSEWHACRHEWRQALSAAVAADDADVLTRVLFDPQGGAVLAGGGGRLVLEAVERIPMAARPPEVRRLEAEARQTLGDWDGALGIFDALAGDGSLVDPGLAWRTGLIHHMRGEIADAIAVYERGDRAGGGADVALLLGWWASAVWLTADAGSCRTLADEALRIARESGDDRALANAYTVQAMLAALEGDRRANEAHYLRALEHAERSGDVLQQIRIHSNRGSRFLEEGNYPESIDETSEALSLAELSDIVIFRALALLNLGQARLRVGMIEEAAADFTAARDHWDRLGSRQAAYALAGLGDVHRARGNGAQARGAYEEAIATSEPVGDAQGLVPALAGLALVIREEDPDGAVRLAEKAVAVGVTLGTAAALVALAWSHLSRGDVDDARKAAEEAARMAAVRRDRAGLAQALEVAAEIDPPQAGRRLDEAETLWNEVGDPYGSARVALARARLVGGDLDDLEAIIGRLGRLGARGLVGEGRRLADDMAKRSRPAVRIETLGGFRVLVDGEPVPVAAWQSKKARDVLKILVARRGRPIHREELIETLWSGEDPAKAANRLSVALTVVRSVLDPDRCLEPDRYLVADRMTVGLAMSHLDVDVETFLSCARRGLDSARSAAGPARSLLERAEGMYRGSFLEEDPYEDWAVALREECRVTYLAVARALAAQAAREGDSDGACRYHLRVLQLDPYDEVAHLGLVREMDRNGRHGEARRLYRHYARRMEELDVEAAPFPAS